jgi:hypothetical protein
MDIAKVLSQLREELQAIDAAIISLERLQSGAKRRGRPPASLAAVAARLRPAAARTRVAAAAKAVKQPS